MKKLVLALCFVFLLMGSTAFGQDWHTVNQFTMAWDGVTTMTNNTPIPEGATIEYVVYLVNAVTDPGKLHPVEIGTTADIEYTFTLNVEGKYFAGCKAVRKNSDGTFVSESIICWSDVVECASSVPWGVQYYFSPANPMNLRKK